MHPGEWGGESPAGLAYSTLLRQFFSLDEESAAQATTGKRSVSGFSPYEDLIGTLDLSLDVADAANIAYDDSSHRLFLLSSDLKELIQIKADNNGILDPDSVTRYAIERFGLESAQGMAVDGEAGLLLILDGAAAQIVEITLEDDLEEASFDKVTMAGLDGSALRGIGVDPATQQRYLLHPNRNHLYEVDQTGAIVAEYDLAALELTNPRALTFAPSADLTDDPSIVHLFIADSGVPQSEDNQASLPHSLYLSFLTTDQVAQSAASETPEVTEDEQATATSKIVEATLDPAEVMVNVAGINAVALRLVRTIETKNFSLSGTTYHIPDPSGMAYIPATATSGHLLVSDAEIEESVSGNPPAYFEGVNLFGFAVPDVELSYTDDTLSFSSEPVGVAYDPATSITFFVDDNPDRVTKVNASGGVVGSFSTRTFNSEDPEGLEFLNGFLYIADGVNKEIYKVNVNGSLVSHFDVSGFAPDPSGLGSDPASGNLLLVAGNNAPDELFEISTTGSLVQIYDISAANGRRLDSVVMAPSSEGDGSALGYYIGDRRQDNNANRLENDGAIYELAPAGPPPPPPPSTGDKILVSSTSGGNVPNVSTFADEDVLLYDVDTNVWSLYFDGSDVGLASFDVDAFDILDDGNPSTLDPILLSLSDPATISSQPYDDSDILRFTPTSLGTTTAGTFSLFFDGSDVGLDTNAEDIDALDRLDDGRLLISTSGNGAVPNVASFKDESLLVFTPTSTGSTTAGAWALYFDGTVVGLNTSSSEDVNGAWLDEDNDDIYLTTVGAFQVPNVTGNGTDIFVCSPASSSQPVNNCDYSLYWDGSAHGFGSEISDAIYIANSNSSLLSSAMVAAMSAAEHTGEGDDPNADMDEGPDDVPDQEHQLFLPHLEQ